MRLAAVAVLMLALAGGLLFFLLSDARRPESEAASGLEPASASEAAKEGPAPESPGQVATAGPEALRQEVESSAAVVGEGAWTVRVLRDGKPAAGVEVVWATPEMHRAIIAAPDPAVPDWMDRLWNAGRRTRSDSLGEALVPALEPDSYVFARDAGAMAYHRVMPADASPIVLSLDRDYTLRARVVDASGAPQGGCRVTAGIRAGSNSRGTTAPTLKDGVASFFHFGVGWGIDLAHARGYLHIDGLFEPPVGVEFDLEPFPQQAIELVLPPHGSVAIEVVNDAGEPAQVTHPVRLSAAHPQHPGARLNARPTDPSAEIVAGKALFPRVGLGVTLEAELDDRPAHEPARLRFDGPMVAGEARTVQLVLNPAALVRFRVLAPSGAPLANRDVQVMLIRAVAGGSTGSGNAASTDAGGFVSLPLTGRWGENARHSLEVRLASPDGDLEGSLEITRPLTQGVNDLGDVLLREPPVLLAGRVFDARGDPIEGAAVHVARIETSRTGRDVSMGSAMSSTGPDGRFLIQGESLSGSLEVHAESAAYVPSAPLRVAPGTRGLEIVLERGGGLQGSLRVPAGVPPRAFHVEVLVPGGKTPRQVSPDTTGRFELLGLTPGLVDVAVVLGIGNERLILIEGVEVRGGESRSDPRLEEIDLTGLVRRLVIRVRAADLTPARGGWVRVLGAAGSSRLGFAFVIEEGEAQVLGRAVPLDLEINVPGHCVVRLLRVEKDQDVLLDPAFSVTLALVDGVELPPAGGRLQVNLVPIGDDTSPTQLVLFRGGESAGLWHAATGDESNAFGPAREIQVAVQQNGQHEVRFSLVHGDLHSGSVSRSVKASAGNHRLDLQPSDARRVFRVAPDRDAYDKTLAGGH
ncbi:MAG TPA: carboxypeptidase-like regulatory domain-containing protein [Planctomycetota bacterium]|nr:carboxypeptidase-like regulatory domain-containing protein [Planctomycetota bacterium]